MLFLSNFLSEYYFINILVLGTSVLIVYLVSTDDRFTSSRKVLFLVLLICFFVLSFFINKAPYEIIKDLFWYSLILNGSFILHVLILDRLFVYLNKNNYDYLAFLVSRTSYFFSFSGITYLLKDHDYFVSRQLKKIIDDFDYTDYAKVRKIMSPWLFLCHIINWILLHFIIIFANYSCLLIGKNLNKFHYKNIIYNLFIFFIILLISLYLGYPRLYIIWSIQVFLEINYVILGYYDRTNISDMKLSLNKYKLGLINLYQRSKGGRLVEFMRFNYVCKNELELEKIYEKPYHKLFMFDLYKFFGDPGKNDLSDWDAESYDLDDIEYVKRESFKKIYKYYTWEELALQYCGNKKNKNCQFNFNEKQCLIEFSLYINKGYNFVKNVSSHDLITLDDYNMLLLYKKENKNADEFFSYD